MRPNPQFSADLVTFNEELLNGKLHFLCSEHVISCVYTLIMYFSQINVLFFGGGGRGFSSQYCALISKEKCKKAIYRWSEHCSPPPPFCRGCWASNQIFKKGGLDKNNISLSKIFFSVMTKNSNWEILLKNSVTFKR